MLTVNDLMTDVPHTITIDTPLRNVIGLMKTGSYHHLPVLEMGKLVGIITDRDVRLVMNSPMVMHTRGQEEKMLANVTAESCMTANPITVTSETAVSEAAIILRKYQFGGLPVVDDGLLVGIITVTDFLDYFIKEQESKNGE